ncbi:hypothetical protein [Streptomyces silvisoli]|uniref:Uncharacterized protein n=1 Tax=Streptomyces silvisoli TaxID=3034235 RepID=A0ABT5ZM29_9ACTN|nr:hypothetical protein [Streptomyces silvisoli]MDF3290885.1 hypothetical protein [Streptomyces silvisoli]
MTSAARARCAPRRAAGLAVAASALLTSFVLHAPPAAAHGMHHIRHTARPTAPRAAHRPPTGRPRPGARPLGNRRAQGAGHPGRHTPSSPHPAKPPRRGPAAASHAPVAARQPRPDISRPAHQQPAERRRDAVDAAPPDPWQDLDQRLDDQRPDQEDPPQADQARPYVARTMAPPALPFPPPAAARTAPAIPSASPTGTADLIAASGVRRPVGPVLDILPLGIGFALTGLGLGFMALRLRRG